MQVYATCDIGSRALERIRAAGFQLTVHDAVSAPPRSAILAQVRSGISGLITTLRDPIDAEVLEAGAGTLKVVAQDAVGLDNVDVEAASRLGIVVTHTPGVLTEATAEFAVFLLGALARKIRDSERLVRSGGWTGWHPYHPFLGRQISGMTVGVVGLGRIGRAFAARCVGLDTNLLLCGRRQDESLSKALQAQMDLRAESGLGAAGRWVRWAPLETLLSESDAISLHVPLTPETTGLIDRDALQGMKPDALLVNTARGPVVDEVALREALLAGALGGAALDVFNEEPLPMTSPLLAPELEDRLLVCHHFGSGTRETRLDPNPDQGMAGRCVEGLILALQGNMARLREIDFVANPEVLG